MEKLILIQQELKAPKDQLNEFGGFGYRTLEGILEKAKPIFATHEVAMIITDDIVFIEGRFYVKAVATLYNKDGSVIASSTAFAREAETKRGMDLSMCTGSVSTYARKYCVQSLLAISTSELDPDATHDMKDDASSKKTKPTNNTKTIQEDII